MCLAPTKAQQKRSWITDNNVLRFSVKILNFCLARRLGGEKNPEFIISEESRHLIDRPLAAIFPPSTRNRKERPNPSKAPRN